MQEGFRLFQVLKTSKSNIVNILTSIVDFTDFLFRVACVIDLALVRASVCEVYSAGKFHWHFTCGFNFRNSLRLPFIGLED